MSLRSNVFSLCKEIQKDDSYAELRALIRDLHVAPDGPEHLGRSDFGYISKHGNRQFYGYLFTDENIETYKQDTIFKSLTALSPEERRIIERGHATLELLIQECLAELVKKYPNMGNALNPYSKFKPIRKVSEQPYLSASKIAGCVIAFRSSPAYTMLMTSPIEAPLSSLPEQECTRLVALMSRELTDKSPDDLSEDIRTLAMRYYHTPKTPETLLFHASCLMVALKDMLWMTCQLLFSAFIGSDIVVINNDNIIRIEKNLPDTPIAWSIILLLSTGMRKQELLGLEPRHIKEDGSTITVEQAVTRIKGTAIISTPKSNDSYRTIPVPRSARQCALKLRNHCVGTYLWESPKNPGNPINPSYFDDLFRRALESVPGVRVLTPHCCRHTYVSQMQALNVPLETIQTLVGHADINMTQHYLHMQEPQRQAAIEKFSAAFSTAED